MIARGVPSPHHPQWGCFEKDQAEALARLGHKVVVMSIDARFARHRGSLGLHHFSRNGVEYYNKTVLPAVLISKIIGQDKYLKGLKRTRYINLAKRIIADNGKPDVIYSQFFTNSVFAADIKKLFDIPLVSIEHLSRMNHKTLDPFDEKWARIAFQSSDRLIAVSKPLAANIKGHFGKECLVVYNMYGQQFDLIKAPESDMTDKPLVFVSVASLIKRKGFDALINAFANANIPSDRWMLKIIGWGEEKENLERLIHENHLEKNIFLLGKMDKPAIVKELASGNVFVLPSRNENFSVAVLEALAMGLPVLATDCGGIRECLNDRNGIITPVDDIPAMANALNDIIQNYHTYNRQEIIDDCRARFSPESIAKQLTSIFESVVRQNSN